MKTIKELLKQKPVFLNNFESVKDVETEFDIKLDPKQQILFASYGQANYSGDAWVLLYQNEELFEANGSHCSCYGLEGQFELERVQLRELQNRVIKGTFGEDSWSYNEFKKELIEFLGL